jgi:Lipocalin-like domain
MSANPLIGTWRLLSWKNRTLDGEVSHPLGEDASGYLA